MREKLPSPVITAGLDRMVGVFGPPKGRKPDILVHELREATANWTEWEFQQSVGNAIRECRFFPSIAELLKARPPKVVEKTALTHETGCRKCGHEPYLAGWDNGRVVHGRYRCGCPGSGSGAEWNTLKAKGWADHSPPIIENMGDVARLIHGLEEVW